MLSASFIGPLVLVVLGASGAAGGVLMAIRAGDVASWLVDLLGEWIVSAARGLGILITITALAFLVLGIANLVSFATGG